MRQRKIPVRTCIACRTAGDKKELLRIVKTPAGQIVVDPTGRLAGRGAYLCWSQECLKKAIKEKKLSRALRTEVPEDAVREIDESVKQGSKDM